MSNRDPFEVLRAADVVPARPTAVSLACALSAFLSAEKALGEAQERVPTYTAQWDPADYYAEEQETWNRAAEALEDAIVASVGSRENNR